MVSDLIQGGRNGNGAVGAPHNHQLNRQGVEQERFQLNISTHRIRTRSRQHAAVWNVQLKTW